MRIKMLSSPDPSTELRKLMKKVCVIEEVVEVLDDGV